MLTYDGFFKQDISNVDDQLTVRFDLLQNQKEDPSQLKNLSQSEIKDFYEQRNAAKIYFGKMRRIVDNLVNIGFDLAYKTPVFKPTT